MQSESAAEATLALHVNSEERELKLSDGHGKPFEVAARLVVGVELGVDGQDGGAYSIYYDKRRVSSERLVLPEPSARRALTACSAVFGDPSSVDSLVTFGYIAGWYTSPYGPLLLRRSVVCRSIEDQEVLLPLLVPNGFYAVTHDRRTASMFFHTLENHQRSLIMVAHMLFTVATEEMDPLSKGGAIIHPENPRLSIAVHEAVGTLLRRARRLPQ